MRFPGLAILAALAAIVLLASDVSNSSLATSPRSAQRFSLDMDPSGGPANTATSLASRESCAAINNCMTQNLNFDIALPPAGADSDGDGVWDLDEFNCGVSTFGVSQRPERMNGFDDDGDGETDESLPAGSETWDCDGDGYTGAVEAHVFQAADRDQRECGTTSWVADFVSGGIPDSTDRVNVFDFVSFLVPVRHLNTNVGDNPGNVRWDIMPGSFPFPYDINVTDLTSLIVTAPPMFGGNRAFNGTICQPIGCTALDRCCPTYLTVGIRLCLTSDRLVYHTGQPVAFNLAVTNVTGDTISLNFANSCWVDTVTVAVSSGTTWGSAGSSVCSLILARHTLAPGETMNYTPPSNPSTATDTYRIVVELNASECPGSSCFAPACQLFVCLLPTQGYAIRRVP